jgi:small-conductance mechanosensitive channel
MGMPDFFDIVSLRFTSVLPQFIAGLAVAVCFWVLARLVGAFVMTFQNRAADDHKALVGLLADIIGWVLFVIGVIAGLGTAGVNIAALVTALGLIGFALSLAMKDILSNTIAGVLIMLTRPYGRGDKVRIDKFQGSVTEINFRHTVLNAPGAKVMVPNAKAYAEVVVLLNEEALQSDAANEGTAPAAAPSPAAAPAISIKTGVKPVVRP